MILRHVRLNYVREGPVTGIMSVALHGKYLLLLQDFKKIRLCRQILAKVPNMKFQENLPRSSAAECAQDGRPDMTRHGVIFHKTLIFINAVKTLISFSYFCLYVVFS